MNELKQKYRYIETDHIHVQVLRNNKYISTNILASHKHILFVMINNKAYIQVPGIDVHVHVLTKLMIYIYLVKYLGRIPYVFPHLSGGVLLSQTNGISS